MAHSHDTEKSCVVYRVSWQDYRGHVPGIGMRKPPVRYKDFPSKEAAQSYKERIKRNYPLAIACVTPEKGAISQSPASNAHKTMRRQSHAPA